MNFFNDGDNFIGAAIHIRTGSVDSCVDRFDPGFFCCYFKGIHRVAGDAECADFTFCLGFAYRFGAHHFGQLVDLLVNANRHDSIIFVKLHLLCTAAICFIQRALHRIGHTVGIHDHPPVDVSCRPPDRLDQRRVRTQEAFLIRIQDSHQRDLRQIQSFPEQVNSHHHIEHTQA